VTERNVVKELRLRGLPRFVLLNEVNEAAYTAGKVQLNTYALHR